MKMFLKFIFGFIVSIFAFLLFLAIYNGNAKLIVMIVIGYLAFGGLCEVINDIRRR